MKNSIFALLVIAASTLTATGSFASAGRCEAVFLSLNSPAKTVSTEVQLQKIFDLFRNENGKNYISEFQGRLTAVWPPVRDTQRLSLIKSKIETILKKDGTVNESVVLDTFTNAHDIMLSRALIANAPVEIFRQQIPIIRRLQGEFDNAYSTFFYDRTAKNESAMILARRNLENQFISVEDNVYQLLTSAAVIFAREGIKFQLLRTDMQVGPELMIKMPILQVGKVGTHSLNQLSKMLGELNNAPADLNYAPMYSFLNIKGMYSSHNKTNSFDSDVILSPHPVHQVLIHETIHQLLYGGVKSNVIDPIWLGRAEPWSHYSRLPFEGIYDNGQIIQEVATFWITAARGLQNLKLRLSDMNISSAELALRLEDISNISQTGMPVSRREAIIANDAQKAIIQPNDIVSFNEADGGVYMRIRISDRISGDEAVKYDVSLYTLSAEAKAVAGINNGQISFKKLPDSLKAEMNRQLQARKDLSVQATQFFEAVDVAIHELRSSGNGHRVAMAIERALKLTYDAQLPIPLNKMSAGQ